MADLTPEEARARVARVEGAMARLESTVNVALVMCRLARLKRSVAALALALVLIALPVSAGCDWQAIEHASIQIDAIPGGYRAVFMAGENCTFSSEGPEVLAALDTLLASLWCDWSIREGA